MATVEQHLRKAKDNEKFALTIDAASPCGVDWAITVLFYVAVHYVQAYLVKKKTPAITKHSTRDSAIRKDKDIAKIYHDYRELETHSRDARYDESGFTAKDLRAVERYLANVKAVVIPLV